MADSYVSSAVSLIYDGGLAASGEIHLYEYSRAVYAYSRLLQTIEFYRREGVVAERIVGSANTDVIIRAPERGSFIIDATVRAAEKVLPFLRKVPFDALLSFVVDTLKEQNEDSDIPRRLAKALVNQKSQRSSLTSVVPDPQSLQAIAAGGVPSTRQVLQLATWAEASSDPAIQRSGVTQASLMELRAKAAADLERQSLLAPHSNDLRRMPTADLARLTSKTRPMLAEVGLPLRKSADNLSFAAGKTRRRIARLDIADIRSINSRSIEESSIEVEASVKSYDRETGHGRLRLVDDEKVYSFSVPSHLRSILNRQIAAGLTRPSVVFVAQQVRDKSESITSFLVSGVELTD